MATKSKRQTMVDMAVLAPLDWVDERTGAVRGTKWFLFRNVPRDVSWLQTLGSAALTAFIVQALTGAILAMYYEPSASINPVTGKPVAYFGIEQHGVWLPDSFGYTSAYPQLARLAGARWFLTQKLSWNETNRLPHHTFAWEGIDGSRVFTHFPPAETYNGDGSVEQLRFGVRNFRDHALADRSLYPFGWGDGGGIVGRRDRPGTSWVHRVIPLRKGDRRG